MGSNDLLGKHCSLLSCSLTCRSGQSRPAETGRHLNSLWHEGGLSSYRPAPDGARRAAKLKRRRPYMDLSTAMTMAASGMKAQSTRLRVVAENLANIDSTAQVP